VPARLTSHNYSPHLPQPLPTSPSLTSIITLLPRPWWEDSRLITDRETGRSRGFGFVTMGSAAAAEKLVAELNGQDVHGQVLRVKIVDVNAQASSDHRGRAAAGVESIEKQKTYSDWETSGRMD